MTVERWVSSKNARITSSKTIVEKKRSGTGDTNALMEVWEKRMEISMGSPEWGCVKGGGGGQRGKKLFYTAEQYKIGGRARKGAN